MMVWLNGEWKEEACATLPLDMGLLRGEGIFETLAAVRGKGIEVERHWKRFKKGMEVFGYEGCSQEEFERWVHEVLEKNELQDEELVRVRVTHAGKNLLVAAHPSPSPPESLKLATSPFVRNDQSPLSGLKALSYADSSLARSWGEERGFEEVLFYNSKGEWCEGSWSNLFAVENQQLVTPPLSSGCLPGVTREVVIELAQQLGVNVREEAHDRDWLTKVEGLFITSSLSGVVSVSQLDDKVIPSQDLAQQVRDAYLERVRLTSQR